MIQLTTIQHTDFIAKPTNQVEVFSTANGSVYQNNSNNRLVVTFAGTVTNYKIQHFLQLKKSIDSINLTLLASDATRSSDFEIISVVGCERVYVLNLTEILALKEILAGAKVMLELNSIVREAFSLHLV